ncbi:MAG: insulinase family protein [Termitinemataceae bacterium]|nr:MAG: insulinase family protein [Termitinemataceae bacterium]
MRKLKKLYLSLFFILYSISLLHAQNIPFMDGVLRGKLKNGLTYYIYENKKPQGRAFLTLAVNAGSVLEDEDQRGLAHFLEHMAFNGTARFPESSLVEYLRSLGMRFGADLNAYTSYDETVYGLEVPIETENGVRTVPQKALDILADWMSAINLNDADVEDERKVIMEEWRLRLGAGNRMRKFLFPLLFEGSKYAKREPIGLPLVIENAPTQRIKDFYNKWYVPNNMAIIICGDFDAKKLQKQLQSSFKTKLIPSMNEKRREFLRPKYFLSEPVSGKRQYEVFTDPELTSTSVSIFYKHEWEAPSNDMAMFNRQMLDTVIDIILSERFEDEAEKPETPFISAGAGWIRYLRNSLHYSLAASVKSGNTKEVLASILQMKERILRYGLTDSEIERAKKVIVSHLERAYNEREKQNSDSFVELFKSNFLSNQYVSSAEWDLENARKILSEITKEKLGERFKYFFSTDDIFVFIYGPQSEKDSMPSSKEMEEIFIASSTSVIEQKLEVDLDDKLLTAVPENGTITFESYDNDLKITNWTLSNGARIIVHETKNQNDQIVLVASARGGHASSAANENITARLTDEMLSASGMGDFGLSDLRKKLSGKQVSFSFNIGPFTRNIQAASNNEDLKTMLEMLYLNFTNPRIEQSAVDVLKDKYKTILENRKLSPESVFRDEITKQIYGFHPYFLPLEISDLAKIDIQSALDFTARCNNPSDWLFVFTGNVDTKTLKPFVETYIASIPKTKPFSEWAYLDIKTPDNKKEVLKKGKEEKGTFFSIRSVMRKWNENDNLTASVLSEYLDIVMIQQIREKLGGVYTISAGVSSSIFPPNNAGGILSAEIYFGCDPNRVDEINAAIEAELKKIADGNIEKETFDKALLAPIKSFSKSLESNLYLATVFANRTQLFDVSIADLYKRPKLYEKITPSDIQAMMKVLLAKKPLSMIMLPEAH